MDPQGVTATKLDINDKEGSGDDPELTVFGINLGTGEIFYNRSMFSLGFFGREADDERVLVDPVGITCDRLGNVYVANRGADSIVRLFMDGENRLNLVGSFDAAASGRALSSPSGVAVENNRVFVADTGNDRIVETDLDGGFVNEINGSINAPFGLAVIASDEWNYFGSSFIAVTDSSHRRLSIFTLGGQRLRSVFYDEISDREGGFFFVAIDYYSNIYVTDPIGGCILKFDSELNYLTRVGCGLDGGDNLVEPRGIAIHRRYGQIFVAEKAGASYFWVGTDVENLACDGEREGDGSLSVNLRFLLTERSTVTARVESHGSNETVLEELLLYPGAHDLYATVPPSSCPSAKCKYFLTVEARATYSSRRYFSATRQVPVRIRKSAE